MTDLNRRVAALAKSRDRLAGLVETLDEAALDSPSYDSEWSIAQVLSHLGSAAEIFERYLDAGLKGIDAPGMDEVSPIWDEWNGKSQREQAESFIRADRALVDRFEGLGPEDINAFRLDLFGLDMTVAELARYRLAEHAVHSWDVAVAIDPDAEVAPDAVELVVDRLDDLAGRVGRPQGRAYRVNVRTTAPARSFMLDVTSDGVTLHAAAEVASEPADARLTLPAAALVRLVYGRLDPAHTPAEVEVSGAVTLDELRAVFPGV